MGDTRHDGGWWKRSPPLRTIQFSAFWVCNRMYLHRSRNKFLYRELSAATVSAYAGPSIFHDGIRPGVDRGVVHVLFLSVVLGMLSPDLRTSTVGTSLSYQRQALCACILVFKNICEDRRPGTVWRRFECAYRMRSRRGWRIFDLHTKGSTNPTFDATVPVVQAGAVFWPRRLIQTPRSSLSSRRMRTSAAAFARVALEMFVRTLLR